MPRARSTCSSLEPGGVRLLVQPLQQRVSARRTQTGGTAAVQHGVTAQPPGRVRAHGLGRAVRQQHPHRARSARRAAAAAASIASACGQASSSTRSRSRTADELRGDRRHGRAVSGSWSSTSSHHTSTASSRPTSSGSAKSLSRGSSSSGSRTTSAARTSANAASTPTAVSGCSPQRSANSASQAASSPSRITCSNGLPGKTSSPAGASSPSSSGQRQRAQPRLVARRQCARPVRDPAPTRPAPRRPAGLRPPRPDRRPTRPRRPARRRRPPAPAEWSAPRAGVAGVAPELLQQRMGGLRVRDLQAEPGQAARPVRLQRRIRQRQQHLPGSDRGRTRRPPPGHRPPAARAAR